MNGAVKSTSLFFPSDVSFLHVWYFQKVYTNRITHLGSCNESWRYDGPFLDTNYVRKQRFFKKR